MTVNPDGTIKSVALKRSWAFGADYAALDDARHSAYQPATVNCKAVEGTYLFRELYWIFRD